MPQFYEKILPSGMAIRVRPLRTRDKLDIDRDIAAKDGDQIATMVATMARCLVAHAPPQSWQFKNDDEGKPTEAPDTDAMLRDIPPNAWVQDSPLSLIAEGTSVVDVLAHLPDFDCAYDTINQASGFGDVKAPLVKAAPARKVTIA